MLAPTIRTTPNEVNRGSEPRNRESFVGQRSAEFQRLVAQATVRTVPDKTPICLPGDDNNSVYLLVSGRAKVCYLTEDGKQPILYFVNAGELFGELTLVEECDREEYVETVEKSAVITLSAEALRKVMRDDAKFATDVAKLIGSRRARIERRLRQLLFLSNRERLTHLLLELAEQYGGGQPGPLELRLKLSHQDLANIIGSTRETVTVVLGKMQLDGLISVRRRRIALLDIPRLAQSVDRRPPFGTHHENGHHAASPR